MICKYCGKEVSNGVGPANGGIITEVLHDLPSSHIFKEAADDHDLDYHSGTTESDKRWADNMFLLRMNNAVHAKCSWYSKWWYFLQAKRNYWAVRKFGDKFFSYEGCKG